MQLLVVTTVADQTGRTISLLVAGLVGIAVALAALTLWYWRHTDPKRQARSPSVDEPRPVEILDPRIDPVDQVDRIDGFASDRSFDLAPVGTPRPAVASIPPSSVSAPSPPAMVPSPARDDDRPAGIGSSIARQWVDPDVWVDAFASDPKHRATRPGPGRPPPVSRPAPSPFEADSSIGVTDPLPGSWPEPDEQEQYSSDRQPRRDEPEAGSAGHSLSDDEWAAITQVAFTRFAETESEGSIEVTGQSPVR